MKHLAFVKQGCSCGAKWDYYARQFYPNFLIWFDAHLEHVRQAELLKEEKP